MKIFLGLLLLIISSALQLNINHSGSSQIHDPTTNKTHLSQNQTHTLAGAFAAAGLAFGMSVIGATSDITSAAVNGHKPLA
jgi:hypothetical protein